MKNTRLPLFKDYSTGQKSLTITGLVVSFFIALTNNIILVDKLLKDKITYETVAFAFYTLAFMGIFVGLYWNKRVRISKDAIEISDESPRVNYYDLGLIDHDDGDI